MSKLTLDYFRTQAALAPRPLAPTRADQLRAERMSRKQARSPETPTKPEPNEEGSREEPDVIGS